MDRRRNAQEAAIRMTPPLVTIGLPVFDGEAYLEEAIRSVLRQSLDDFELVISDNASTDRTGQIGADFAATDRRVRYRRNARNVGAAANYDLTFHAARGPYFKWLAHDDRLAPQYLERTVAVLEARSEVVLCNARVRYIDGSGRSIGFYDSGLAAADAPRPSARFAAMTLRSHSCVDFFGVARAAVLRGSLLHARFHGADRALLAQLALRGRLAQVPEPLAEMREHPGRYTRRLRDAGSRRAWHDPDTPGRIAFPAWRLYGEYVRMMRREPMPAAERLRCAAVLARWWGCNWNAVRALVDLVAVVAPAAPGHAERLKARIFGAAPGHLSGGGLP